MVYIFLIPLFLQLLRKRRIATFYDSPLYHHVYVVRSDVLQNASVVSNDQRATLRIMNYELRIKNEAERI